MLKPETDEYAPALNTCLYFILFYTSPFKHIKFSGCGKKLALRIQVPTGVEQVVTGMRGVTFNAKPSL